MVVSTLNSRRRIFHYPECTYASRIKEENLVTFFSKDEARACGYRHCIHCSRLLKYYKEDQEEIDKFIKEHHIDMYIEDDSMFIENSYYCWKITVVPDGYGLILYHGNTEAYDKLKVKNGHIIHNYHLQKYHGKYTILHMLQYIVEHDNWRADNMNSYKSMPRRTKKQRREYNKAAKTAKKKKMTNLYNTMYKVSLDKSNDKNKRGQAFSLSPFFICLT